MYYSIYSFEVLISFLLDKYSGEELLDHMIVQFLTFLRNLDAVFHNDCTNFHSHPHCMRAPISAHVHLCIFDNSHSNRCEEVAHCGLDLHFPDD